MFFPEFLIRLSQRDQQVTWLDPFLFDVTEAAAAASVQTTATGLVVPADRALILQSAHARANPGAAQTVSVVQIAVFPSNSTAAPIVVLKQEEKATDAVPFNADWSGSILLPPSWRIAGTGTFNAGVAANQIRLSLAGILIPAANIQRI